MKTIVLFQESGAFVFDDLDPVEAVNQVYFKLGGSIRYEIFGDIAEKIGLFQTIELFNECCDSDSITAVYERCIVSWEEKSC